MRTTLALALALLPLMPVVNACTSLDEQSPFDDDDNGDDSIGGGVGGKADGAKAAGYRSGCGSPIRTGKYALRGDVITPTGVLVKGYVVVDGEKIAEVRTSAMGAPTGMTVIDTKGIISPGLIDGHGHVE